MRSRFRFVTALTLAVLLAVGMGFYAFKGNTSEYAHPGELAEGKAYTLNARVAPGAPSDPALLAQSADGLRFVAQAKDDPSKTIEIAYRGTVPDQFKAGRDIVVKGELRGGVFHAERGSMIAQCPSKFQAAEDKKSNGET